MPSKHPPSLRLDPRTRIVAAIAFAIVVVTLSDLAALTLALLTGAVAAVVARLPLGPTLKRVLAMDLFIVVMLLMLPFTMAGEPLFHLFGFTASLEGTVRAVEIALKANAVVLMLLAMVGGMETSTLAQALYRLKTPPVLVHLLMFTVRYISVLHGEYGRLRTAMRARGFAPRTDRHTLRTLGYLVGMVLVRSLDRAERVLAAMKCRGFDGRIHVGGTMDLGRADALLVVGGLALAAVLIGVAGR